MSNTVTRIKKYIDHKGISIRKFEESVGFSNGSFASQYKNNKTIGVDKVEQILRIYPEINPDWLLTGKEPMLRPESSLIAPKSESLDDRFCSMNNQLDEIEQNVRNIAITQMGEFRSAAEVIAEQSVPMFDMQMALSDTQIAPKGFVYIPDLPRCDGAIRMYGDHMTPVLKGGDIIVYRKVKDLGNEFFWGSMYMLSLCLDGDEQMLVRYVHRSDESDSIRLTSENSTYPPKTIPLNSIKALAEIKASIRYHIAM